ncbi:universal stress protein [Streptomyces sp. TRM75563]|uniref:universal stress protein n=1 Tax=Streptomyces sp. TRM75563 TaxID=2817418 RepID=UPI001F60CB26|nr:universal stress protein [Streptomyces sp. TRM75563]MCI4042832.1 universal stress protein [Streptomyces sp. TRM75563]
MNSAEIRQEIVVGVDPRGDWHPAVAWGADEARLRGLDLRLALSVPPRHDTQHVDDAPHHRRLEQDGRRTLEAAISWAHARWPETGITGSLLDGFPGRQLAFLSLHVRLVVVAEWEKKYPDVQLHHEVQIGSLVEVLAEAGEHTLGIVVGRRGKGGYTGMRVGSVVHGLLHRAHCPVITVPAL